MEGKRGTAGAHPHIYSIKLQPSHHSYRESIFRYLDLATLLLFQGSALFSNATKALKFAQEPCK